jgi:hypothetical protein
MNDNRNTIMTEAFSSPTSARMYKERWPDEPATRERCDNGDQCGGCSYFAPFNTDWGLCAHPRSRHHLETVFEHFACPSFVDEGWGPHNFTELTELHCRCGGVPPDAT